MDYLRILQNSVEFCRILQNSVKCCRILQNFFKICRILQNFWTFLRLLPAECCSSIILFLYSNQHFDCFQFNLLYFLSLFWGFLAYFSSNFGPNSFQKSNIQRDFFGKIELFSDRFTIFFSIGQMFFPILSSKTLEQI